MRISSPGGGDEFAIILPRTEEKAANAICSRIRTLCAKSDDDSIKPSIALGCATKVTEGEEIQIILKEAEDRMYRQKLLDDRSVRSHIIASLKKTLFEKSFETEAHARRMMAIAERFGSHLGLTESEQADLNLLAIMHDMGKIAVPHRILMKVSPLNDEEWEEIRKHPEAGYRIAKSSHELAPIADYILSHHERWDGRGYPQGLKEREIPRLARIISIIDTYDVMTGGRIYERAVSHEAALEEIHRCAGSQFDPHLAKLFLSRMG